MEEDEVAAEMRGRIMTQLVVDAHTSGLQGHVQNACL